MTARRAAEHPLALAIHDSTHIVHGKGEPGRDFYDMAGKTYGYISHVTLLAHLVGSFLPEA